uniref:Uncharacterized protein n=1 Tax=Cacopsylla melanoneura TaxID=428564 RepID=A0A8D8ZV11_9HEMI
MWEYSPKVGIVFLGGIFPTGGNLIIYWEIYSLIIVGILFLGGIFPTSGNLFIYCGNNYILLNSGNLFLWGGRYSPKVEFFLGEGGIFLRNGNLVLWGIFPLHITGLDQCTSH